MFLRKMNDPAYVAALQKLEEKRIPERNDIDTDAEALRSVLNDHALLRTCDAQLVIIGTKNGWGIFVETIEDDAVHVKSVNIKGSIKGSIFNASFVDDRGAAWSKNDNHEQSLALYNQMRKAHTVMQSKIFASKDVVNDFLSSFKGYELISEIDSVIASKYRQFFQSDLQLSVPNSSRKNSWW